jgi:hypothetical protein
MSRRDPWLRVGTVSPASVLVCQSQLGFTIGVAAKRQYHTRPDRDRPPAGGHRADGGRIRRDEQRAVRHRSLRRASVAVGSTAAILV